MLRMKYGKKINRVFARFMVSYLIILGLTMLTGSLAYSEALKMTREDAIEDGLAALEKGRDILEARLMEVENMIVQLSLEPEMGSVLNIKRPLKTKDYYKIRKAYLNLPSYSITNNFIDDFYIFFENPQVLLSSRFISVRVEGVYNEFLEYKGMSYKEWQEKVLKTYYYRECWPVYSVGRGNHTGPMITYIQSIPLGSFHDYKGAILVLIKEDKMLEPLMTLDVQKNGWLYIADDLGRIITSYNLGEWDSAIPGLEFNSPNGFTEKLIDGEKFVVLYTSSSYMNWNFVAAIPARVFEEQVSSIRMVFVITIAVTIALGVIMAFFLAYRNSRPIKSLIDRLKEAVGTEDYLDASEYDFIEGKISQLVRSNKTLQEDLKNQVPFLRAGFFERLLRGEFKQFKDLEMAANYANLKIAGDCFIVLLMRLNGYNGEITEDNSAEIDVARVVGAKVLKDKLWGENFLHNIDEDKMAVLLILTREDVREYEDRIEYNLGEVISELQRNYNIRVSFGIGNMYTSLLDVSYSFREAAKALDYRAGGRMRRVLWFHNIPQSNSGYYYPIDLELKLMNLAKSGEESQVLVMLKQFYIKNFIQNSLSSIETEQLIYEIRGTIIKIKDELISTEEQESGQIDGLIKEMDEAQSAEGIYDCAVKVYQSFCAYVNQKRQSRNDRLLESVMEYINSSYIDDSLCLFSVASEFDLTEKYFSQFFKERTGENFSAYVEKVRMENAIKLLGEGELSITDIASQVGYTNNNTFYKAFKRIYGISPSVYRRQNS